MNCKTHGVISLLMVFSALVLGIVAIAFERPVFAIAYGLFFPLGFGIVLYSYCTKCSGRFNCAHVLPGKLAHLMPARKGGIYTYIDYCGVIIPLLSLIIFPQPWLWKIKWILTAFWVLILFAVLEISIFICVRCPNSKCVLCRNSFVCRSATGENKGR